MDAAGLDDSQRAEATRLGRPTRSPRCLPAIDAGRCTGCGRCVGACAPHVLSLAVQDWKKRAVLDSAGGCTGCSLCALRCPFDAITMRGGAAV